MTFFVILAACPLWVCQSSDSQPTGSQPTARLGKFVCEVAELQEPVAVAVVADNKAFALDWAKNQVVIFNRTGAAGMLPPEMPGDRIVGLSMWPWANQSADKQNSAAGPATLFLTPNGKIQLDDGVSVPNENIPVFVNDGRYSGTRPVAIALKDRILAVADTANDRVVTLELDANPFGLSLRELRSIGGYGTEPGKMRSPSGVAFGDDGSLYVSDSGNNRIQVFDRDGNFLTSFGDWGFYPGLFSRPEGLAFANGQLFVADSRNHRIQVLTPKGEPLYEWGMHVLRPGDGQGRIHYPSAIAVSPDGSTAVVAEPFQGRCQVFTTFPPDEPYNPNTSMLDRSADGASHYGRWAASDGRTLIIPEPDSQLVNVYDWSRPEPIKITQVGGFGAAPGRFNDPAGVALLPDGDTFIVADSENRRLQVFRLKRAPGGELKFDPLMTRLVKSVDLAPRGVRPEVVARSPSGEIHVTDPDRARVIVFDDRLNFLREWSTSPSRSPSRPADIAFSPDGQLEYVADAYNRTVNAFDPTGKYQFSFATDEGGDGADLFGRPSGLYIAPDSNVYVTDADRDAILKFDSRGRLLAKFGKRGIGPGEFNRPSDILAARDGNLLVLDYGNHRGVVITPDGGFVDAFGARQWVMPAKRRPSATSPVTP